MDASRVYGGTRVSVYTLTRVSLSTFLVPSHGDQAGSLCLLNKHADASLYVPVPARRRYGHVLQLRL